MNLVLNSLPVNAAASPSVYNLVSNVAHHGDLKRDGKVTRNCCVIRDGAYVTVLNEFGEFAVYHQTVFPEIKLLNARQVDLKIEVKPFTY